MGNATPELAVMTVRVERDRLDALRRIAAANRRTLSQELRWLIDQALDQGEGGA